MIEVPRAIPLDMPPGDAAALEDLVQGVAGVAHLLTVLSGDLAGPGAAAPGWLGDDAVAATVQVAAVAGLTREMAGAVLLATARLSSHADRLRDARRQIADLRAEQDEDHRLAWQRVSALEGVQGQFQFDGAAAVAIVEDLRVTEDARRRRHAALLAEVADDASAVAHALGGAGAVVGGTAWSGDDAHRIVHLAARLPGWGDAELAARGRQLATRMDTTGELTDELADAAWAALPLANSPAFANALLAELGPRGLSSLMTSLGSSAEPYESPVATLLASALGAAVPGDSLRDPVGAVVNTVYAGEQTPSVDVVVAGMVAVLSAGAAPGARGVRPDMAAAWARQFLLLEKSEGKRVGEAVTYKWPTEVSDPVAIAGGIVADSRDPEVAAALLEDPDVWQSALSRSWADGGAVLGDVAILAAQAPGEAGAQAVRLGLETVGSGLFEGDPRDWTVGRETVDQVSSALGTALAGQIHVAVDALSVGIDGSLGGREDALRGLAYVSVDRSARAAVESALVDWSRAAQPEFAGPDALPPHAFVAIPAAFLAAQEHGNRLAHALDGFEARREAESQATWWNWTIGLPTTVGGQFIKRSLPGAAVALAEDYLAMVVGSDGTWDNPVDTGDRFTSEDAVAAAHSRWELRTDVDTLVPRARAAFDRTVTALGHPAAPVSPETNLWAPIVDLAIDEAAGKVRDVAVDDLRKRIRFPR